jgi:MFS family permease
MSEEDRVYRRVTRRLLPLLFIAYLFAFLDRVNVGYAKLQMQDHLGFSDAVYGLGAGIFFVTYLLFEVPSNLWLERVGARVTLLRIMVLWGLTSAATMLVQTPAQFYAVRLLLGVFEAGFFPGVVLYLTWWFPSARRARVTGQFMIAASVAGMIGGPLSGFVMTALDGAAGLAGWQWLFLVEGLPTVAIGIACYCLLDERPKDARWLDQRERAIVAAALAADTAAGGGARTGSAAQLAIALRDAQVYLLAFIYFCLVCGYYAFSFWLPTLIQARGVTDIAAIGWYSMLPYAAGCLGIVVLARSSDRRRERRWHVGGTTIAAAVAFALTTWPEHSIGSALFAFCAYAFFMSAAIIVFWSIPPTCLAGPAAPVGIALVSSLGISGGFASPTLIGYVRDASGNVDAAVYALCALLVVSGLLTLFALPARVLRVGGS